MKLKCCYKYLIVFLLTFVLFGSIASAKSAETLKDLRKELSNLQAEKKANESEKQSSKTEIKNKTAAISTSYQEIEVAKNRIEIAKEKIAQSEIEIENITDETNELMRSMQIMSGENAYFEYISSAGSLTEMIMRMAPVIIPGVIFSCRNMMPRTAAARGFRTVNSPARSGVVYF